MARASTYCTTNAGAGVAGTITVTSVAVTVTLNVPTAVGTRISTVPDPGVVAPDDVAVTVTVAGFGTVAGDV